MKEMFWCCVILLKWTNVRVISITYGNRLDFKILMKSIEKKSNAEKNLNTWDAREFWKGDYTIRLWMGVSPGDQRLLWGQMKGARDYLEVLWGWSLQNYRPYPVAKFQPWGQGLPFDSLVSVRPGTVPGTWCSSKCLLSEWTYDDKEIWDHIIQGIDAGIGTMHCFFHTPSSTPELRSFSLGLPLC